MYFSNQLLLTIAVLPKTTVNDAIQTLTALAPLGIIALFLAKQQQPKLWLKTKIERLKALLSARKNGSMGNIDLKTLLLILLIVVLALLAFTLIGSVLGTTLGSILLLAALIWLIIYLVR